MSSGDVVGLKLLLAFSAKDEDAGFGPGVQAAAGAGVFGLVFTGVNSTPIST